jgi:hypothetical protein
MFPGVCVPETNSTQNLPLHSQFDQNVSQFTKMNRRVFNYIRQLVAQEVLSESRTIVIEGDVAKFRKQSRQLNRFTRLLTGYEYFSGIWHQLKVMKVPGILIKDTDDCYEIHGIQQILAYNKGDRPSKRNRVSDEDSTTTEGTEDSSSEEESEEETSSREPPKVVPPQSEVVPPEPQSQTDPVPTAPPVAVRTMTVASVLAERPKPPPPQCPPPSQKKFSDPRLNEIYRCEQRGVFTQDEANKLYAQAWNEIVKDVPYVPNPKLAELEFFEGRLPAPLVTAMYKKIWNEKLLTL